MHEQNIRKAKLNISTTLLSQLVATACGIVIPRVMIKSFGSATYGLTTSIAQFLAYISLLESGIGRVGRAELYKPLAEKNAFEISRVYNAVKYFFRIVGIVFIAYTLVLSFSYYDIAEVEGTGRTTVFLLIWVISTTTLAKYMGGLANLTLLNADQRQYIGNTVISVTTVLNALLVVLLTRANCGILTVKLGSSLVYIAQPVCYAIYAKKLFKLPSVGKNRSKLSQKWTGIGQHIAYFLHTNTDVVMLTLCADIRLVAVYTVYSLVISSMRKIAGSFTSGMEAAFGEMIAKKDKASLHDAYRRYKFMLSFTTIVLFGTTAALVVPFVRLYTSGITDADYIQPAFAIILLFAEAIDCVMFPCSSLPVSANRLKETKWGSYGEAAINISLSLILIWWNPLIGVALGTLIATVFKSLYYMIYSGKYILEISIKELMLKFLFTSVMIGTFALAGTLIMREGIITTFYEWLLWAIVAAVLVVVTTLGASRVFYPKDLKQLLSTLKRKK